MEVEVAWSPSPSVQSTMDSDCIEVWEEIVLEEDGSPQVKDEWNADYVLALGDAKLEEASSDASCDEVLLVDTSIYRSPSSSLTPEEEDLMEESFNLLEDLMSSRVAGDVALDFTWGDEEDDVADKATDNKTLLEKAQDLLKEMDRCAKQEPFSDWLEEKTDLPLLEDLGITGGGYQSKSAQGSPFAPYQPRSWSVAPLAPSIAQIAPHQLSNHLVQHSASPMMERNCLDEGVACETDKQRLTSGREVGGQTGSSPVSDAAVLPASYHPYPHSDDAAPLTPALIREFETVLHQKLTPPHSPPTYIDLVNTQEEEIKKRKLAEDELDALINSQVASLYDDKKDRDWSSSVSQNSPNSDWSSAATPVATEDSDSACLSSSECDPDWAPSGFTKTSDRYTRTSSRSRRTVSSTEERKMRKKEQNKNAATRYRLKKKAEQAVIMGEESVLLDKNVSLKESVTELKREIKILKSLMREVFKAKGLIQ